MNLQSLQTQLTTNKWMMEKSQLLSLYDSVQNLKKMGTTKFSYDDKYVLDESDVVQDDIGSSDDGNVCIIGVTGVLVKGSSLEEEVVLNLTNIDEISYALDQAANDPSVECIFLCFASPGGETTGIIELGRKIRYIDENIKPIFAWTEKQMASAAVWLGSQCRAIGMTESAQIGSCGVYMIVIDASKKYEMEGINIQTISSGHYKTMGHDDKPLTPEEKDILVKDVTDQHEKFKSVIREKRPSIKDEAMEGLSYEGPAALENGWTDYICDDLEEYIRYCLEYNKSNGN